MTDAPPADPAALDAALARLGADPDRRLGARPADRTGHDGVAPGAPWLVVTSATAVRVVAGRTMRLPAGVAVACVGEATARAAREARWPVDLVPDDESAAGLVAALPDTAGPVLFPRSEIAAPTVVDGLRARGIDVSDVVAYRTVGTGDDPVVLVPPPDAVLVTSGSVAQQVVRRMTPLDPRTLVACIGPATADAARAAGLPVHVVARGRSAAALLDAVVETLHPNPRTGRSS
ncbi:uroporphyrinogen-III synthase [Curtobacterium citreum]|uniref:uroporphyrinogen-III synthase n=1 Tax=Curtobacterium citreum TaxID=2036 RepID=UPI00254DC359|nr:uroporphyrinogen-III synthase [Curtobacterium citreum]MDK8171141.1 uroporphyrinogen-III synthase [Curtobacterium citreum]